MRGRCGWSSALSVLVLPWLILLFPLYAALRRIPVYEEFVEGGKEGVPGHPAHFALHCRMLVAVGMFSAAGGMDLITWMLSPVTNLLALSLGTGADGGDPAFQRQRPRWRC